MNSAAKPNGAEISRLDDRRAMAMPSPTTAATAEPRMVARMVIFTPSISVGMISRTKFQSHSTALSPHPVEAARHPPLQRAHAPGDHDRHQEIENDDGGEGNERAARLGAHDMGLKRHVAQ